MRLLATLLVAAMAGLFLVTLRWPDAGPAMPWLRAFAEAGMVGGLADWFAVTALFRRPLGLPIPHTAIIPEQKDRLGDTLAGFLRDNFLQPRVVVRRLETADLAGVLARWLQGGDAGVTTATAALPAPVAASAALPSAAIPSPALHSLARRQRGFGPMLARLVESLDDPAVTGLIEQAATRQLAEVKLSPLLAGALDTMVDKGRHEPLVDAALDWGLAALSDEEPVLRGMVSERAGWLLRLAGADDRMSDAMIGAVQRLLVEMRHDPFHPVRLRLTDSLKQWAFDLRHFAEAQDKVEALKGDLMANPALGDWARGLWGQARAALVRGLEQPGGGQLGTALAAVGRHIAEDEHTREAVNAALKRALVGLAHDHGDAIVTLVSDTVRGWDAETVTDKVEQAVGRDLQFIRINGTLIGGSIGLAIHGIAVALA